MRYCTCLLLLAAWWCSSTAAAQQTDTTGINQDSLELEVNKVLAFIDSMNQPRSSWYVSMGFANTQFSRKNIALNAQQLSYNLTLVPSIAYFHRSGLGLTYNNFLVLDGKSSGVAQHAITPSFDYTRGKKFDVGVSYTRFLRQNNFNTSPYENDWYGYVQYKKTKFKPSVAMGYSTGGFTEFSQVDTFALIRRVLRPDTLVFFRKFDTLQAQVRDLSFILSVRRQFELKGFGKQDYFTITPAALLFFARNQYEINYSSGSQFSRSVAQIRQNNPLLFRQLQNQVLLQFPELGRSRNYLNNSAFNLQSLGLSVDGSWYIGKFYMSANLYLDYFLLSSESKLNAIFSIDTGFAF